MLVRGGSDLEGGALDIDGSMGQEVRAICFLAFIFFIGFKRSYDFR
jgi:hypothetical protein